METIKGRDWCEYFLMRTTAGDGGCILWNLGRDAIGYGRTTHTPTGENKAHRISWQLARGLIPKGQRVLHRCDVRHCVNPDHLFLGTQADNVADMVAKGRNRSPGLPGTKNPQAKLTENIVREMRRLHGGGKSQHQLAREWGVSPMTVNRAVNGKCWSHVK